MEIIDKEEPNDVVPSKSFDVPGKTVVVRIERRVGPLNNPNLPWQRVRKHKLEPAGTF
jgi:hypothetical protein